MDETKILVIYHGNCADGFGAAWVFWKMQAEFNERFEFFAGTYQKPPPDVEGKVVYLVDFSYKKDVVKEMLKDAVSITLIDHHKTAIEDLQDIDDYNFFKYTDLNRSGAMLAWDYWHNTNMWAPSKASYTEITKSQPGYTMPPLLLDHIQDRDLWKFKLPGTREIQSTLFSYEYDFELWDRLMQADHVELMKMTVTGAALERKHHKDIAELVKVTRHMRTIGGCYVPVASLPYTMSSDAGHLMAKEYENGKFFAACYWDTEEGRTFSLRSVADIGMDVSEIAKSYGGGGHKNAAGFSVPFNHSLASRIVI